MRWCQWIMDPPRGPDHVGVRDDRAVVMGNTMLQHAPDGSPMFMHTNLGKPTVWVGLAFFLMHNTCILYHTPFIPHVC